MELTSIYIFSFTVNMFQDWCVIHMSSWKNDFIQNVTAPILVANITYVSEIIMWWNTDIKWLHNIIVKQSSGSAWEIQKVADCIVS